MSVCTQRRWQMPVPFSNYKDNDGFKRYMARYRVETWIQRISKPQHGPEKLSLQQFWNIFSVQLLLVNNKQFHSPKCSANPITVTLIMKWEFENKGHPIRGLYMTFFEKFLFKFPFSYKRFQMEQKMYSYQLYKL